VNTNSTILLK